MRADAERRAEEKKKDLDNDAMMEVIGDVGFVESDLKHNEAVEKFINHLCEETSGEFYDAISGEALDGELTKEARKIQMETFKKRGCTRRFRCRIAGGSLGRPRGSEAGRREQRR